jgi:hypothetical protein
MKRPPRKLANNFFEISVLIFGVRLKVYLSLQKVIMSLSIYEVKTYSLLYNFLYQIFQFPVPMEHLNLRKQEMVELLSMDHHRVS